MSLSSYIGGSSLNYNLIVEICLAVIFVGIWWRKSLAAIASLSMIAAYYIVDQGANFINSWLTTGKSGLTSLQLMMSVRLAIIIVLPLFVLFVLKALGKRQPAVIRILSAAVFSGLMVWYVVSELVSGSVIIQFGTTNIYTQMQRLYPALLIAALILAALELWFIRKSGDSDKKKKAKSR